jgi:hypothetical protein
MHRECGLRNVIGSVGHVRGTCSCKGGTEDDPPGHSKRDQARLAVVEMMASEQHPVFRTWPVALRAKMRPTNFNALPAMERWRIDKALNLLDWEGHQGLN